MDNKDTQQDVINNGDYVIIRKDSNMWLHRVLTTGKSPIYLKKDKVWLNNIVGRPYFSVYRIVPQQGKNQHIYEVEEVEKAVELAEVFAGCESGRDNRNIVDNGLSQKLSTEDIAELQEKGLSGQEIVSQLIENSATFKEKTGYSQEKYLKKKQRKYLEYITVLRPTLRLVSQILYNKNPNKIMNLRPDSIAQMLTLGNVRAGGRYLVYETGCQGLAVASVLDRLRGNGKLIHVHPGNIPQRQAVSTMNFNDMELESLHGLSVTHLMQHLNGKVESKCSDVNKRPLPVCDAVNDEDTPRKRARTEVAETVEVQNDDVIQTDILNKPVETETTQKTEYTEPAPSKKRRFFETLFADSKESLALLTEPVDGLLIVSREDPSQVLSLLMPFLGLSRSFVVFCQYQEPLLRSYMTLKEQGNVVNMRLTETWLRHYQVLPDRTHPQINMSGSGGYLLSGIAVDSKSDVSSEESK